ncbi:MAG: prolipoprotein diacylglyceryl transferase [Ruminococcus sp.]|nr:prolipoprotein diacylglyceryl transferase [Ruminococcus sp.]
MSHLISTLVNDLDKDTINKIRENPSKVYFPNFGDGDNIFREGITVDRVMFTIPGTDFKVYWYGFFIAVGLLLAMVYGFRKLRSVGVDPDKATDGVIAGFFGALIGARLYYIAFNEEFSFSQFFKFREGGLAIYGGIIGAILVGGIVVKLRKVKLTPVLDVVGPCFLIGQCIGRWGNFFNQEAFGSNTGAPWGMMSNTTINYVADHYDDLAGKVSYYAPVHPCFLYESLWCLLCFIILHIYFKHRKFDGEVFLMYAGLYGLGRFFIESTRTDSLYLMNIKVSQLVAGASFVASLVLIIIFRNLVKRNDQYKLYVDTEISKAQLKDYDSYDDNRKEKKELKDKIKKAKAEGESTEELEKEYEEKFGKAAKEAKKAAEKKLAEADEKVEVEYTSILADDDEDEEDSESKETSSEDESEEDVKEEDEKDEEENKDE